MIDKHNAIGDGESLSRLKKMSKYAANALPTPIEVSESGNRGLIWSE